MKRGLWGLLPLFLLIFSACDNGDTYIVEDDNPHMQTKIIDYTIQARDWTYVEDENGYNPQYLYEATNIPEIAEYNIYTYGIISVYLYQNSENKNEGYLPLSDAFPFEQEFNGEFFAWTEYYTYILYPRSLKFIMTTNDFEGTESGDYFPGKRTFRIVLNWY